MRFTAIILLFFIKTTFVGASDFQILIEAKFPGAQGQTVRLKEYVDQISYREAEITSAVVDETGAFQLRFSRFEAQYVFFRIDHARMGFFVEPGKNYQLVFDEVDFNLLDDTRNPYLEPWYFPYTIKKPEKELNYHINRFDVIFEEFLVANFATIHRSRNRQLFFSFKQQMDSVFEGVENPYFRNYYKYKFANYFRAANIQGSNTLKRDYIFNKPVLYQNTQYMNFFNTVFDTYIFAGSRNITISDLRHTVNTLNSYDALMDSLGKDTLLRNEVLREVVMLKALKDMHANPEYRQTNVKSILEHVTIHSKFPRHRTIAENILYNAYHLTPGTVAPNINLSNSEVGEISIPQELEEKFIYLSFWATWCETCFLDQIAINELYAKYKEDFIFISISTDRHKKDFQQFMATNPTPWLNFHFDHDFRLLDSYGVKSLPLFVIIGPDGKVISYPALRPEENIARTFDWLLYQRKRQ